jgi:hypothetical protein
MASFAMVFAGAPMFMWRWAIACAVFINNISATYYSREKVWATPYELTNGEPFPDSSIVVPFGCAALVLLEKDDRTKFQATCAMVIFIHYAQDHPLYTYAFFSPRTKRVLFRQNCIMLPEIFPMREARSKGGLLPDGEELMVYRPRPGTGKETVEQELEVTVDDVDDEEAEFAKWKEDDPLPSYLDDITGHSLVSPSDDTLQDLEEKPKDWPTYFPSNPLFGPPSVVPVPKPGGTVKMVGESGEMEEESSDDEPKNKKRPVRPKRSTTSGQPKDGIQERRPVNERWFYELVQPKDVTMLISSPGPELSVVCDSEKSPDPPKRVQFGLLTNEKVFSDNKEGKADADQEVRLDDHLKSLQSLNLGLIEAMPEYLEQYADNEDTARALQGMLFEDKEIGWCEVTGNTVDHGTNVIYYTPVGQIGLFDAEDHASLASCAIYQQYQRFRIINLHEDWF